YITGRVVLIIAILTNTIIFRTQFIIFMISFEKESSFRYDKCGEKIGKFKYVKNWANTLC
ncbi:MAG: hypothetical protein WCS12_04320, partial [Acholeplasmataceae bacterium]